MDTSPTFTKIAPHPMLTPYIECYWMLSIPAGAPLSTQQMPADGRVELMFSFGGASRRWAADGSDDCTVTSRSYLLGVRGQGYAFDHDAPPRYVAVRFKPAGWAAFAKLPADRAADLHVGLDVLWGAPAARELEDRLESAPTPQAVARLLDAALIAHLTPPDHLVRVLHAARRMQLGRADLTMPDLAGEINVSQKHFERLFIRFIGYRPSYYARIARFQRVLYGAMMVNGRRSLGQLAQDAGYYDQAHFSKDFKRFSGSTPRDFFAAQHGFVQVATPEQVVEFLQDFA